jgi:hypothetical protein
MHYGFRYPDNLPRGRVLVHNQVRHTKDQPHGHSGFRCWTQLLDRKTRALPLRMARCCALPNALRGRDTAMVAPLLLIVAKDLIYAAETYYRPSSAYQRITSFGTYR